MEPFPAPLGTSHDDAIPEYLRGLDRGLLVSWAAASASDAASASSSKTFVSSANWVACASSASTATVGGSRVLSPPRELRPCLACGRRRAAFHCQSCVSAGAFCHSRHSRGGDKDFCEVSAALSGVEARVEGMVRRVEEEGPSDKEVEAHLREKIKHSKSRLRHLRAAVDERRRRVDRLSGLASSLASANEKRRRGMPKFAVTVRSIGKASAGRRAELRAESNKCVEEERRLAAARRRAARQVAAVLYPIEEVYNSVEVKEREDDYGGEEYGEEEDEEGDDDLKIKGDLLDAMDTSYVNGKWVNLAEMAREAENTSPSSSSAKAALEGVEEVQYRVVAPTLPPSGDYSVYIACAQAIRDYGDLGITAGSVGAAGDSSSSDTVSGSDSDRRALARPAHAVSAALMFLSHSCLHLSSLLDVALPSAARPRWGDFGRELTPSEFSFGRRVARLNLGVFLLCLSQGVAPERLKAARTAANMAALYEVMGKRKKQECPVGRVYRASTGRELLAAEEAGREVAEYLDRLPRRAEDEAAEDDLDASVSGGGRGHGHGLVHEEGWDSLEDGSGLASGTVAARTMEELAAEVEAVSMLHHQGGQSPPPPSPLPAAGSISGMASSFISSLWGGGSSTST